jgi:hypothetical protein
VSTPTSQGLLIGLVGVPRFAERVLEIEGRTMSHRRRLVEARRELEAVYGEGDLLAAALRRLTRSWCFADVNALIDEHNRWFPIERNLPLDPATGEYLPVLGRTHRLERLGSGWAAAAVSAG